MEAVKERYREVLEKLDQELDHSASLEVRDSTGHCGGEQCALREPAVLETLPRSTPASSLPRTPPPVQEQVRAAADQLAEANARYNALQAERGAFGGLQVGVGA